MKGRYLGAFNYLKRIFSNNEITYRIYIYWGIATLIFFGYFGMYPVTKIFLTNFNLLNNMYKTNLKMEKKVEDLKIAQEKIDIVGDDILILDKYLPNDFECQTYMVDLAFLAGDSGYSLDRISFSEAEGSKVALSLGLSGKGDLHKLVESLESSGRLSEVQDIKLSIGDKDDNLTVVLKSFIMEKE